MFIDGGILKFPCGNMIKCRATFQIWNFVSTICIYCKELKLYSVMLSKKYYCYFETKKVNKTEYNSVCQAQMISLKR